ncbi:GNAT family N-acetyltransferase [Humibacter antri]
MPGPTIKIARTIAQARTCFPVFAELRPHLDEESFLDRWQVQARAGYEIAYVQDDEGVVVAAAGYREMTTMAWGRILYLDDLIARSDHVGTGLGTALLRYLQDETRRRGCDELHLDTGYTRHAAHRSYLRNGFDMVCHHMAWPAA